MSQSLSFTWGSGLFVKLRMSLKFKKSFPFWLGFEVYSDTIRSDPLPAHLLRSKLAPLTGSLCALMRINLNSSINVMGTQIRRMRALAAPGGAMSA